MTTKSTQIYSFNEGELVTDKRLKALNETDEPAPGLCLRNTEITDKALTYLNTFSELRGLDMSWAKIDYRRLYLIKHLGKSLQVLYLEDNPISDEAMDVLKAFTELRKLSFSGCAITDKALEHFRNLRHLQHLDISFTAVTNAEFMPPLPELKSVDASFSEITNDGVASLARLPGLSRLNLYHTRITDAALSFLLAHPCLKTLNCKHTRTTAAGKAGLVKSLPADFKLS